MAKSLSIVGAGRVGRALGRRLRELGWKIGAVASRTEPGARKAVRFIGGGQAQAGISPHCLRSRTILIAVPDDAIASVADELARIGGETLHGKSVLHTSGALDASVLSAVRACGAFVGSLHPLQTFSGVGVPPLEGRVFGVEGDALAVKTARRIARALGGIPVSISAEKKPLYHAAGAFAAGHLLALEEGGVQMLMSAGMKRREAVRALLSLSRQVLDNYEKLGPHRAWTGPLSRRDYGVVTDHEATIGRTRPEFLEAYQVVSRLAARVLSNDPETVLRELEAISQNKQSLTNVRGGRA
jgi:predicted short-subunit dehydrogenase-like oxidoreductase (DUF2520 family)